MSELEPAAMESPRGREPARRRAAWLTGWLLLFALHVTLVFQFVPPSVIFSERPIYDIDFSLHWYQVDRATKAFRQSGRLWGWDPHQLAGQPVGAIEDISSKTLVLFVIGLTALGVPQALAFNLYVLLLHLLLPVLAVAAGRLFRLGRGETFILALLWALLWFFDSFLHWCLFCGMISWAFVSGLAVVVVGAVYRAFGELAAGRLRWRSLLGAALGCAAVSLMHPLAMMVVALPAAMIYLDRLRVGGLRHHLLALVCVASAVLAALVWLLPAIPIHRYIMRSDYFLRPTAAFLLSDFLDLQLSASATGPPVQTMLRTLCLGAAAILLWRWRRQRDSRWLPLSVMVLANVLLAYGGRYLPLTSTAQPYRAIAPATLAAALPAAVLLRGALSWRALRALSPAAAVTLAICAFLLVPRVVRTFLYFFPELAPSVFFERRLPAPSHPVNTVLGAVSLKMQNHNPPRAFRELRAFLLQHHRGRGRVLVEDYELGEYLAANTDLPIIGGFAYRPLHHADANLFRFQGKIDLSPAKLRAYFERYAIGFVIFREVHWRLENSRGLLEFQRSFGGMDHRVFATRIAPDYVMRGQGRVVLQELNRIVVEGAGGPEIALRFHWLDSLRCRPGCTAERLPVDEDRVGFIRVRRPPPRFEIYNGYSFGRAAD